MKDDKEIRSHIIGVLRQYGAQPAAVLHVLTGYVAQLQELMKRDQEDAFVDRVCLRLHPGQLAQGVYCKLCHDVEMAGKFGSLPPEAQPKEGEEDDDLELMDIPNMKPPEGEDQ